MNAQLRLQLVAKVKKQESEDPNNPAIVSLEDFFNGNDDEGSIGCNTDNSGPQFFREPLFAIRAKPEVQDVFIEITDLMEEDENSWPFSDYVYVLTSAPIEEVSDWLVGLNPDSVEKGWSDSVPSIAPKLATGIEVYLAWWD